MRFMTRLRRSASSRRRRVDGRVQQRRGRAATGRRAPPARTTSAPPADQDGVVGRRPTSSSGPSTTAVSSRRERGHQSPEPDRPDPDDPPRTSAPSRTTSSVDCLPTPNDNGCPTKSCFPAGASIPSIEPGESADDHVHRSACRRAVHVSLGSARGHSDQSVRRGLTGSRVDSCPDESIGPFVVARRSRSRRWPTLRRRADARRPSHRPTRRRRSRCAARGSSRAGSATCASSASCSTASPRQQTSEMLSAAPGFFVDHEDGEGLGNDVYLRGFDLDHGSGIEMRVGNVPINIPTHIQGQGYADANFIIPEVVRSIRVLEGPYDPRQGDAAIVGSAYFDLGVAERGYQLKATYGSFNQARVVGDRGARRRPTRRPSPRSPLRQTDGFGQNRASAVRRRSTRSTASTSGRAITCACSRPRTARARSLPGVVRQDDVDAGRIGFYDCYPPLAQNQGVAVVARHRRRRLRSRGRRRRALRVRAVGRCGPTSARARTSPAHLRARRSTRRSPASAISGRRRTSRRAGGVTSRFHAAPMAPRRARLEVVRGARASTLRVGHTDQTKSLLNPETPCTPGTGALDAGLETLDAGGLRRSRRPPLEAPARLRRPARRPPARSRRRPAGERRPRRRSRRRRAARRSARRAQGVAVGPRVTAEYDVTPRARRGRLLRRGFPFARRWQSPACEGAAPYSKVRSRRGGLRAQDAGRPLHDDAGGLRDVRSATSSSSRPTSGGLRRRGASMRRGVVGSFVAKPFDWLLVSSALSVTDADVHDAGPGRLALRAEHSAGPLSRRRRPRAASSRRSRSARSRDASASGYTFLVGRHLTDTIVGPSTNVLNAERRRPLRRVEVGVDAYNLLGLRYADDAQVYVSNWSNAPGPRPASLATHIAAAPPRTLLATVTVHFESLCDVGLGPGGLSSGGLAPRGSLRDRSKRRCASWDWVPGGLAPRGSLARPLHPSGCSAAAPPPPSAGSLRSQPSPARERRRAEARSQAVLRDALEAADDERRPAGLVARADAAAVVAVEILVEEHEVARSADRRRSVARRRGTAGGRPASGKKMRDEPASESRRRPRSGSCSAPSRSGIRP